MIRSGKEKEGSSQSILTGRHQTQKIQRNTLSNKIGLTNNKNRSEKSVIRYVRFRFIL